MVMRVCRKFERGVETNIHPIRYLPTAENSVYSCSCSATISLSLTAVGRNTFSFSFRRPAFERGLEQIAQWKRTFFHSNSHLGSSTKKKERKIKPLFPYTPTS